jgi:hypothetical protein
MGFLQSAINQVGRDMGRVVRNTIFKDRHAIPIRRARSYHNQGSQARAKPQQRKAQPIQEVQKEFEKAIDFKTGYRPTTLISKLGGAFIVIKNEARAFIDDGYLDVEESQQLFEMMKAFNHKCSDVEDVIGFTEDENSKAYKQLENIHGTTQKMFHEVLKTSVRACQDRAEAYEKALEELKPPLNFGRFLGLYLLWFPKYAKGGEKRTGRAVLANILDIITLTFVFTRLGLFIMAIVDHGEEKKKYKHLKQAYRDAAEQERERAKVYSEVKSNA